VPSDGPETDSSAPSMRHAVCQDGGVPGEKMDPDQHFPIEAASGIEPLYKALQDLYATANSLVKDHFNSLGERRGSERGAKQRHPKDSSGQYRRPLDAPRQTSVER